MAVRNQLVHCEMCDEDYAATYRRCPFCNGSGDTDWDTLETYDDEQDDHTVPRRTGRRTGNAGRHLASTNSRGGGYGGRGVAKAIFLILSLALIVAAAWILLFLVLPKLLPPSTVTPPATGGVGTSSPVETISPNPPPPDTSPIESGPGATPPVETPPVETPPVETPPVETPPAETTPIVPSAASLKLSSVDFTLDNRYPTYHITATGGTGNITWSISNDDIATISAGGLVTARKPGNCTVTATDEAGAKATCIVRVAEGFTASGTTSGTVPSPSPSQNASAAKLSHSDVTLSNAYGTSFTLRITGWEGSVTWSSSNTNIATVSESGLVKAVASGTCTISATLSDGTVLKCTIYVNL